VAERIFRPGKRSVSSPCGRRGDDLLWCQTGIQSVMYELENNESLVLRAFGYEWSPTAGEWKAAPLMAGVDRLFREIGAYLEFVAIARGR